MALNPSTNATMSGRVTAADANYPYGSAKNETTPGAGDGTPYFKARADDIFGFQQALLIAAGLTPSGNADTVVASQYLDALKIVARNSAFPSGTVMTFVQAAAPTSWTKSTTHNNKALRIVSGSGGGFGGSVGFTTAFNSAVTSSSAGGHTHTITVAGHVLTVTEMPLHSHGVLTGALDTPGGPYLNSDTVNDGGGTFVGGTGGDGAHGHPGSAASTAAAHTHTTTLDVLYVDAIICVKN